MQPSKVQAAGDDANELDDVSDDELDGLLGALLGDDDDAEELDDFVKYEQARGAGAT